MDELTINNGIDLASFLTPTDFILLDQVEEIVQQSVYRGDVHAAMVFGRALRRGLQVNGIALAKLLAKLSDSWELFQAAGIDDEFVDVIYAEIGVSPSTTNKYVAMWKAVFDNPNVPQEALPKLYGQPIKSLLLLTAAAREGSLDWNKVSSAVTTADIRNLVKQARGEATSSGSAIHLSLDVRDGTIWARQGVEKSVIGVLLLTRQKDDALVEAGIQRLIRSANIMEV